MRTNVVACPVHGDNETTKVCPDCRPYEKQMKKEPVNAKKYLDKNLLITSWTSWYCPFKHCEVIIYNTAIDKRKLVIKHMMKHVKNNLL